MSLILSTFCSHYARMTLALCLGQDRDALSTQTTPFVCISPLYLMAALIFMRGQAFSPQTGIHHAYTNLCVLGLYRLLSACYA